MPFSALIQGPSSMDFHEFEIPGGQAGQENQLADSLTGNVEELLFDFNNNEVLCVTDMNVFEDLLRAVRCFEKLERTVQRDITESLASNLQILCQSIGSLLACEVPLPAAVGASHRSALRQYVYLLFLISKETRRLADHEEEVQTQQLPGRKRQASSKRPQASNTTTWCVSSFGNHIATALVAALQLDLETLYGSYSASERLLDTCVNTVMELLGVQGILSNAGSRAGLVQVIAYAASRNRVAEGVAEALLERVRGHKDGSIAKLAAEAAAVSNAQCNSTSLGVHLLLSFALLAPKEYDDEFHSLKSSTPVKNVADMLVELARSLPKVVGAHASLLLPYLACVHAHVLRSAIVDALAAVVCSSGGVTALTRDGGERILAVRSKEHILTVLMERLRDKSAFTRQHALKAWRELVVAAAVPLPHMPLLLRAAVDRLRDSSVLVVRSALTLLAVLVTHSPFGQELDPYRFSASLVEKEAELQAAEENVQQHGKEGPMWAVGAMSIDGANDAEAHSAVVDANHASLAGKGAEAISNDEVVQQNTSPADVAKGHNGRTVEDVQQRNSSNVRQGGIETLRMLIATLKLGKEFAEVLVATLPQLRTLLACPSGDVVQGTITLITQCKLVRVPGADGALRAMWPLVFSREEAVRGAVVDAFYNLYMTSLPAGGTAAAAARQHAHNLIELMSGCTLGELAAMEEMMRELEAGGLLSDAVVAAVLSFMLEAHRACIGSPMQAEAAQSADGAVASPQTGDVSSLPSVLEVQHAMAVLRNSVTLLSIMAPHRPQLIVKHTPLLLQVMYSKQRGLDAWVLRYGAATLRHLAPHLHAVTGLSAGDVHRAIVYLSQLLLCIELEEETWYSVAEASVAALYSLHKRPSSLMASILARMAEASVACGISKCGTSAEVNKGAGAEALSSLSSVHLAHFFFVLGAAAAQHLVHLEHLSRTVRQQRRVGPAAHSGPQQPEGSGDVQTPAEDIAAQIGGGSAKVDADLEQLSEDVEHQVASTDFLIGAHAQLLAKFCHRSALMAAPAPLRSAAVLALTKLMAVDVNLCSSNLQLIFTLVQDRRVEPTIRSNAMVALGDLVQRFPNTLEPWTAHMYAPLADNHVGVRKTCLMVLTHLILNDMMKVKGHVSKMALCLLDAEVEVEGLARLFFTTLAGKTQRGGNPLLSLMPDILSALSHDAALSQQDFATIMTFLLDFVKDKHSESLREKLCARYEGVRDVREWQSLAFCLTQLAGSSGSAAAERSLRRCTELLRCYRHALGDATVYNAFKLMSEKARKASDKASPLRDMLLEYEETLSALHNMLASKPVAPSSLEAAVDSTGMIEGPERVKEAAQEQQGLVNPAHQHDSPRLDSQDKKSNARTNAMIGCSAAKAPVEVDEATLRIISDSEGEGCDD